MKKFLILSLALGAGAPPVQAQLVQNGSFESPGCSAICLNPSLPSWVNFGSVESIGPQTWIAGDGNVSMDLNGVGRGGVGQTISNLTIGAKYDLSFLLSKNYTLSTATLDVLWLAAQPTDFFAAAAGTAYTFSTSNSLPDMKWSRRGQQLTATSTSMFLGFRAITPDGGDAGPALDNVTLAAVPSSSVPEPSTYALMVAGLIAIGTVSRRTRSA